MSGLGFETVKIEAETFDEEWLESEEAVETMETQYYSGSSNHQEQRDDDIDPLSDVQQVFKEEPEDVKPSITLETDEEEVEDDDDEQPSNYQLFEIQVPSQLIDNSHKVMRKRCSAPPKSASNNSLSNFFSTLKFVPNIMKRKSKKAETIETKKPRKGTSKKKHFCMCCPASKPPFDSYPELLQHLRSYHANSRFSCLFCPRKFADAKQERVHLRERHAGKGKPYKCSLCPAIPDKVNPAKKIMKSFKNMSEWLDHLHRHRKEQQAEAKTKVHEAWARKPQVKCTYPGCSREFYDASTAAYHAKSHERVTKFPCMVPGCDREYKVASSLEWHMKTVHEDQAVTGTGPEEFKCPVPHCKAKFEEGEVAFEKHVAHHLNTTFGCPHCPARFKAEAVLQKHLMIHTALPFRCTFSYSTAKSAPKCGAGYKTKDQLLKHMQESHNEKKKSYRCQFCQARDFAQGSELRKHAVICQMRIREPQSVAKVGSICPMPQCPFRFFGEEMEQHLRAHILAAKVEGGGFGCVICKLICPNERTLVEHLQNDHDIKLAQACKIDS